MNRKILYIEDDNEVRENYTFILESYFGQTHSTAYGKEAIELFNKYKFDLILIDIDLPDMDGLDIAKYIRKKDTTTSIIMLTAYSDRDRLLKAVNMNLQQYLIKPVDNNLFIDTIKNHLSLNENIQINKDLYWQNDSKSLYFNNELIKLTKKELILVSSLLEKHGSCIEKDTLILKIWEDEFPDYSYNQKLTQLVYRLNKKLVNITNNDENFVSNYYSIGYKIENSIF